MNIAKITKNGLIAIALAVALGGNGAVAYTAPVESNATVQAPVNLNQASADELMTLKGIGPKTAERIIAYRSENGPFQTVDQLVMVKGIGNVKFEKIKDQVTV